MMETFVGCNCYYLLEKASDNQWDLVTNTLQEIHDAGFNVVRTWAFNSDPSKAHPLQTTPQAPGNYDASKPEADQIIALGINQQALDAFDTMLGLAHEKGLKLMLCLTNSLADYGGMPQFVRWAGSASNDGNVLRQQFWSNTDAQAHCRNYITFMVTHINKLMQEKGFDCVHSWDICNEPRNPGSSTAGDIVRWVASTANLVKSLDAKHLVTVGTEGFWGQADVNSNDPLRKNPYGSGVIEGCDWRAEVSSPSIDFVCIHPYGDNWGHWDDALSFNEGWITGHLEACRTLGKQLVVQEYNMPSQLASQRSAYYTFVKDELLKANSPLAGAMVWMVGDPSYPGDQYMICPGSADWTQQQEMCTAVNRPTPS